jgi:hypothetical protein
MNQKLSLGDRLRLSRIAAGYKTAIGFANKHGINPTTYHHHENGRRALSREIIDKYASLLGTQPEVLIEGFVLPRLGQRIPIVGHVLTATGSVVGMEELDTCAACSGAVLTPPKPIEAVPALSVDMPDFSGLGALVIVGSELWPAYRHNDIIMHDPLVAIASLAHLDGRECVVELADGRRLLRVVLAARDGKANLVGFDNTPHILGVDIIAAAPIRLIMRDTKIHRDELPPPAPPKAKVKSSAKDKKKARRAARA